MKVIFFLKKSNFLRIDAILLLGLLLISGMAYGESTNTNKSEKKSRQKRFLWITEDGRLALPPGTTMVISPSLSMPFVRYPPSGFFSNMTISLPFTIDFNKLGLTDNENPYGVLPPYLARSMGRAAGNYLSDYIARLLDRRNRKRRSLHEEPPQVPAEYQHAFHGGERALLYVVVEGFLENFGMDGRACLLRAICEVHQYSLKKFGLLGEMMKLFFSASKSPYSHLLKEYVAAENAGRGKLGSPGECWPYMKECPKSLFAPKHNKYSDQESEIEQNDSELNENEVTFNENIKNM